MPAVPIAPVPVGNGIGAPVSPIELAGCIVVVEPSDTAAVEIAELPSSCFKCDVPVAVAVHVVDVGVVLGPV